MSTLDASELSVLPLGSALALSLRLILTRSREPESSSDSERATESTGGAGFESRVEAEGIDGGSASVPPKRRPFAPDTRSLQEKLVGTVGGDVNPGDD